MCAADLNRARAAEYEALFKAEKLSPSNNEIPLDVCCALLRGLRLKPSDRFMDLGSARGRLVFAAAATAGCTICGGAELSPSDHTAAGAAFLRMVKECSYGGPPPQLYCCDLRSAPLRDFNVFYCAIRGDASRPRVVSELVARMLEAPLPEATCPPRRLILAGFGIDLQGTPFASRVKLVKVYALRASTTDGMATPSAGAVVSDSVAANGTTEVVTEPLALYGDSQGPRFLLEYAVG